MSDPKNDDSALPRDDAPGLRPGFNQNLISPLGGSNTGESHSPGKSLLWIGAGLGALIILISMAVFTR